MIGLTIKNGTRILFKMSFSYLDLIHGLRFEQLEQFCREAEQPVYRARQIWHWLYLRQADDWQEMKNLPAGLKALLAKRFLLESVRNLNPCKTGRLESTTKLLLALQDGHCIESVLIPAQGRCTVCVSSQVGCKYNCAFCASGKVGLKRDLSAGEIVGQVVLALRLSGDALSNVVFMGIGEPLDNYRQVLDAVRIINDCNGLNIGARRITLSTCGLVPGIRRLANEGLQVELSVSLHAPGNELRSRLMPVNKMYPLDELLAACAEYTQKTGRIITFEYTLISGINDSSAQARALAGRLSAFPCRMNLIPLSAVSEFNGQPAPAESARKFIDILKRAHINATLRASKGGKLNAACGQLRYSRLKMLCRS